MIFNRKNKIINFFLMKIEISLLKCLNKRTQLIMKGYPIYSPPLNLLSPKVPNLTNSHPKVKVLKD